MKISGIAAATMLGLWSYAAQAAVESLSAEWAAGWSAKNLDAVMALYAPDAVFLPAIGPRWEGRETIRKNCAALLANYNPQISLVSLNTAYSDDIGYESGSYDETITSIKDGKVISANGNYLFVFKRAKNGAWKILEQSWTSLTPPPAL
jgi:uncharacterized protein (TIGR02246 family)